ncbi:GPN-loop GTPase 2 [Rhinolophus ferrumequinum]|uniref:GPN-loop GTPase 2 n=1 Tax=Rhinolophus ferrumequinum TaxID=59479 RepID=A0A7J7X5P8_RHIFE|nr:GPN-loop GTPase 2 [Rhinolophus ferrumequinum]
MAGPAPTTAFGQAVIGPPGSGKTTYCLGMSEFLRALGRPVAVVNLDPANEGLPPSGALHTPRCPAQHLLPDGTVGPPADCCPPGGFSLLHRPGQVHFSSVYLPGHHAARRAASRQPPLQDGPH